MEKKLPIRKEIDSQITAKYVNPEYLQNLYDRTTLKIVEMQMMLAANETAIEKGDDICDDIEWKEKIKTQTEKDNETAKTVIKDFQKKLEWITKLYEDIFKEDIDTSVPENKLFELINKYENEYVCTFGNLYNQVDIIARNDPSIEVDAKNILKMEEQKNDFELDLYGFEKALDYLYELQEEWVNTSFGTKLSKD